MRLSTAIISFIAVMLSATIYYSCGSGANSRSRNSAPDCKITGAIDSLFESVFPDDDEPGGIVMIVYNDTVIYNRSFGVADLENGTRITDTTLFNLSSASKVFSTIALLKLNELGLIGLDDSLSKYFPELPANIFDRITIRHILSHSSGLPDLRPRDKTQWDRYLTSNKSVFISGKDYALYGDDDEHMRVFRNLVKTDFDPGTHYERNDPGYILVAPLIERATGVNFDKWMADNIFKPAGMEEAFYYTPDLKMPEMAHGYRLADENAVSKSFRSDDGRWDEYDFGEAPFFLTKADRGVYTSARDYMRWKMAVYSGTLVSDSSLLKIGIPHIRTEIPYVSMGLGTAVRLEPGYPKKTYHLNSNGGFAIVSGTWANNKLYYLVFSNRNDWDRRKVASSVDSIMKASGYLD